MVTLHLFVFEEPSFPGFAPSRPVAVLHSTTRRHKLCRSCGSWTVIAPKAGACEQALAFRLERRPTDAPLRCGTLAARLSHFEKEMAWAPLAGRRIIARSSHKTIHTTWR